jgi:hypothetical protein
MAVGAGGRWHWKWHRAVPEQASWLWKWHDRRREKCTGDDAGIGTAVGAGESARPSATGSTRPLATKAGIGAAVGDESGTVVGDGSSVGDESGTVVGDSCLFSA